jgi:transposase
VRKIVDTTVLLGVSKRGNPYVRRLLIHHLNRSTDRLGSWLTELQGRMHTNKVIVALANKIARMAWALITRPDTLYRRAAPQCA